MKFLRLIMALAVALLPFASQGQALRQFPRVDSLLDWPTTTDARYYTKTLVDSALALKQNAFPTTTVRGIAQDVYLARRTDGLTGAGTAEDPYDASTAAKVDSVLRPLSVALTNNVTVHFAPDTTAYETYGYGDCGAADDGTYGWFLLPGWTVYGYGAKLKIVPKSGTTPPNTTTVIGTYGGYENMQVHGLTIDCNWTGMLAANGSLVGASGIVGRFHNGARIVDVHVINHHATGIDNGAGIGVLAIDQKVRDAKVVRCSVEGTGYAIGLALWSNRETNPTGALLAVDVDSFRCSLSTTSHGINFYGLRGAKIHNSYFDTCSIAIFSDTAPGNVVNIADNTFRDCDYGMRISGGSEDFLQDSRITGNDIEAPTGGRGIFLEGEVLDNVIANNRIYPKAGATPLADGITIGVNGSQTPARNIVSGNSLTSPLAINAAAAYLTRFDAPGGMTVGGTTIADGEELTFAPGSYANPGSYGTSSAGDKLILYYNASDFDARMGVGTDGNIWWKALNNAGTGGIFEWFTGSSTTTAKLKLGPSAVSFPYLTSNGFVKTSGGTGTISIDTGDLKTGVIGITIDGGGSAITTGVKGYISIPYACTINSVTMLGDQSGSAVVDCWKDTYANYPPTVADTITASAKPTITAATKSTDATLTGWTTSVSAGDVIGFNVDSASTITRLYLILKVTK